MPKPPSPAETAGPSWQGGILLGGRRLFLSHSAAAWNAFASNSVSYSSEMSLFV